MAAEKHFPGLESKLVLVTAGAAGIGRQIAADFVAQKAQVVICDLDEGALASFLEQYPQTLARRCDVCREDDVAALFAAINSQYGRGVDILVNCAGISGPALPVEEISLADWNSTLEVSLTGSFNCIRRAVPAMKDARAGVIINFSSTAGQWGYPFRAPYVAAKWGVIGLSKSLASELGPDNIRVNAICPGAVEGDRMDRVVAIEAAARGVDEALVREEYVAGAAMKQFVTAEDISNMVLFAASDLGRHISGQALTVDGHTLGVGGG